MKQCHCLTILDKERACPQCGWIDVPNLKIWALIIWIGTLVPLNFHIRLFFVAGIIIYSTQTFIRWTILLAGNEERKKRIWNISTHEYLTLQRQLQISDNHHCTEAYQSAKRSINLYEYKLAQSQTNRLSKALATLPLHELTLDKLFTQTSPYPELYAQTQTIAENEVESRLSMSHAYRSNGKMLKKCDPCKGRSCPSCHGRRVLPCYCTECVTSLKAPKKNHDEAYLRKPNPKDTYTKEGWDL